MLRLALVLCLSATPLAALAQETVDARPPAADVPLTWEGKGTTLPELLPDLPEERRPWVRAACESWGPFAEQHELALHLTDGGRTLLVQRASLKPKKNLALVAKTAELFDRLLPVPERLEPEAEPEPDPEATEAGVYISWSYEDDKVPLESEVAVLVQVPDQELYEQVLAKVAQANPYLEGWVERGKKLTGFVFEKPLVACWQERPDGMEEWDIENELVHRLAHLLFHRRFGQPPYWLTLGIAWTIEEKVQKAIYCFPYRDGFVWATEHGDWWPRLRNATKQLEEPFRLDHVASWKRGTYDSDAALMAYGTAQLLVREFEPEQLAGVLEHLRFQREQNGRTDNGDGTWSLIPDYEVPVADQEKALEQLHPDFVEVLGESFAKGKGYKLPKR